MPMTAIHAENWVACCVSKDWLTGCKHNVGLSELMSSLRIKCKSVQT